MEGAGPDAESLASLLATIWEHVAAHDHGNVGRDPGEARAAYCKLYEKH
jgi:hypothetical protein